MKLERGHKVVLYVISALNEFEEAGLINGRAYELNLDEDIKKQMEGFEPTETEIMHCMEILAEDGAFGPRVD
jgi:hypothetical protein